MSEKLVPLFPSDEMIAAGQRSIPFEAAPTLIRNIYTAMVREAQGGPPMTDLNSLADRLEKATGPDRELDGDIAAAFGQLHGPGGGFCNDENGDYWSTEQLANPFTASLDAAMTLIPEQSRNSPGEWWSVERSAKQSAHPPHVMASAWVYGAPRVYAATPALALAAAALRARAQNTGDTP